MERLTPQQIECLQLRVAGLRYREIADVMGIGISAVGELVQRAMVRLNEGING
jgi:DNA-binding CsgD family transcriptional regulator